VDVKYEDIVIAAYLHDVGKFAQRADEKKLYNVELENKYCKEYKGYYSHQHVIYTAEFIDRYKLALPKKVNPANVLRLAASHHSPSTVEEWIITEADRLSSGSDRCNILDEAETDSFLNKEIENEHNLKFYE
jgi:CRISPR-associated protein Csm1